MSFLENLSQRSSYASYKRRISVEKVLEYYGAQNCTEIEGPDGSIEVVHSCLIDHVHPHHTNGDVNPSAHLNVDKKLYNCWSYGGGDIIWLIKTLEQKETLDEIIPVLSQLLEGSVETSEDFMKEIEGLLKTEADEPVPTYNEKVLDQWAFTHPYLLNERGVSHEAAKRLRVGYDIRENRIVFPLFFHGKLLGWQKRAIPPNLGYPATEPDRYGVLPKYKNTSGFPKSKAVYNYDLVKERGSSEVIVVESPMSVLKAETLTSGDDILSGVIATFGAKVSDEQLRTFREFQKVYVWTDSDPAGRESARRLIDGLSRYTECYHIEPEYEKDLADYNSKEEVVKMIEKAQPAFLVQAEWSRNE